MKKILKVVGYLLVAFILLTGVLTVVLKVYFTPEKVKALIEKEAAAHLHRQVSLGSISVGIVKGLEISEFKLSESPDFSKGTFISSEKFVLHLRLIPLLFKKVLIREISLVHPHVSVVRFPDGKTYNFTNLTTSTPATPQAKEESASSLTLLVSKASISQGTVVFTDQSPARQSISIDALDLNLRNFSLNSPMDLQMSFLLKTKSIESKIDFSGTFDLIGNLKIKTCSLTGGSPAGGLSKISLSGETKGLLAEHPSFDLALGLQNLQPSFIAAYASLPQSFKLIDPLNGSLKLEGSTVNLSLKNLSLSLGSLQLTGDGQIEHAAETNRGFRFRLTSNEIPLEEFLRHFPAAKPPREVKLAGNIQMNASVNGTADSGQLSLKIDAKPAEISYGDSFRKSVGVPLTIEASTRYAGSLTLDFSPLTLTLGRLSLSGPGKYISDPKSDRYFFDLKSNSFPLEDVAQVLPPLHEYELSGKGNLTAKIVSTPSTPDASGVLTVSNASLRYQESQMTQLAGSVNFTPDTVTIPKLTGLFNGSSLKASVKAKNIKTHPMVSSDIEVAALDLDKVIPNDFPAKTPQKKTDAGGIFVNEAWAAPAPEKGMMDLPMDLSGNLKVGQLKQEYFSGEKLDLKWNVTDVTKDLSKINGSATLRQGPGEFKKIDKLTAGSTAARILLLPVSLLQKLNKAAGAGKAPSFDQFKFKEILGDYTFRNGVMNLSKFTVNGGAINAIMTGTVGLAGQQPLDLKAQVKPKSGSDQGFLELNFQIRGTALDPKIGLDAAATGKQVLEAIKGGAADSLLQKYGLPTFGKPKNSSEPKQNQPPAESTNPSTPSAPPTETKPDSSDQDPAKQIEGLLKGLFKK